MTFAWVGVGFFVAVLVHLDGKVKGPYFAFTQVAFGYPELVRRYTGRPLWQGLVRRAVYPFGGGLLLGFLSRSLAEAVAAGLLAFGLLIWPVLFNGLPAEYSTPKVVALYAGLMSMGAGLCLTGWYAAQSFGTPRDLLGFLGDQLIGVVAGVVLTAFGALVTGWASRDARDKQ